MEGFSITPQVEGATKKILDGTLSIEEYVNQVKQQIVERKTAN
jgi:hypothetical protein